MKKIIIVANIFLSVLSQALGLVGPLAKQWIGWWKEFDDIPANYQRAAGQIRDSVSSLRLEFFYCGVEWRRGGWSARVCTLDVVIAFGKLLNNVRR